MNRSNSNVGKKIMILQEQLNHQKKIQQIYYKSSKNLDLTSQMRNKYSNLCKSRTKKNNFQEEEHTKNIKKLYQVLSKEKSMRDRVKDPHDFFAFPVYFFRYFDQENRIIKKKTNPQNTIKRVKSQKVLSNVVSSLSKQKIKQYIPHIQQFDQSDLQLIADGIHKIIITFNVMNLNELFKLEDVVLSLIRKMAPEEFVENVEQIFFQISEQFKN